MTACALAENKNKAALQATRYLIDVDFIGPSMRSLTTTVPWCGFSSTSQRCPSRIATTDRAQNAVAGVLECCIPNSYLMSGTIQGDAAWQNICEAMATLIHIIEVYGLWVVFFSVLLDQGGLPTPSYAPTIVTAALATDAGRPLWPILVVGVFAALLADVAWFAGGRRFGAQLLRLMCRMSLSPDSCVGTTRRIYEKVGPRSLILAKYIPGFAAVSTTLAGQAGTTWRQFLLYDGIGAALWMGGAVALGTVFHEVVE